MKNRRRNTRPDDRARTRILCYGEVCRGALGLYSTWSRLTYCALRNTDQQNSISGSQNACKSVGIKLPHALLINSNNPRAKKRLKAAARAPRPSGPRPAPSVPAAARRRTACRRPRARCRRRRGGSARRRSGSGRDSAGSTAPWTGRPSGPGARRRRPACSSVCARSRRTPTRATTARRQSPRRRRRPPLPPRGRRATGGPRLRGRARRPTARSTPARSPSKSEMFDSLLKLRAELGDERNAPCPISCFSSS